MKKSKCFYSLALIFGFIAVFMIFVPQIRLGVTDVYSKAHDINLTWPTFFGGEVGFGDGQRILIRGISVLPFIGYCLVFVGALIGLFTLSAKTKNGRATAVVFAFLFLVVGTVFIWCTRVNFEYNNSGKFSTYTINYIKYGIGSLLGAIFSTLAPVTFIIGSIFDKD